MIQKLIDFDKDLFLQLNGCHNSFSDFIFWWASNTIIWAPLYIFVIFLLIRQYGAKSLGIIFLIVISILISDQLSVFFKNFFHRLRPSQNPDFSDVVHIVNNYRGGMFGFVSSHAANTATFAFITVKFLRNKWLGCALFLWVLFVSYSRIALGVHYPADITGGILLSLLTSFLLTYFYKFFQRKFPNKKLL